MSKLIPVNTLSQPDSAAPDADGHVTTVRKGDAFVLGPGFKRVWDVVTRIRKHYAIYLP